MTRDGRGWHGDEKGHREAALKGQTERANNTPMRKEKKTSKIRKIKVYVTAIDSRTESVVGKSYIKVNENIPKILIDNALIRQTIANKSLAEREYTVFKLEKTEDQIIEKIMQAIRKSTTEGSMGISLPWGQGWRREYGYDYNTGNYWAEGYGHSGYSTTGWHDQSATIYTEAEMKQHISKHFRKFKKAYDSIQGEVN